jgi:mevalonate kinase
MVEKMEKEIKNVINQIDLLKEKLLELYKKQNDDEIFFSILALINAKQHLLTTTTTRRKLNL